MSDIQHILVPTDGSPYSLEAAAMAGDLARALSARITVLLVLDHRSLVADAWNAIEGGPGYEATTGTVDAVRKSMEDRAADDELARTLDAVGEVAGGTESVQIWGHPAEDICRYAEQHQVDLIVMGSHGRSAFKRAILGSVSHAVVNTAHCAVTIVKQGGDSD